MGAGLKRVAKQCGGLEVIGTDGKSVRYDADGLPACKPLEQKRPDAYSEKAADGGVFVMHKGIRTHHENQVEADRVVNRLNGVEPGPEEKVQDLLLHPGAASKGASAPKAGGLASVKNYDEAPASIPARDPRTLVYGESPSYLLSRAVKEDAELKASPLGQKILKVVRDANAGNTFSVTHNDQSYLEPLQELLALRGADSPEGVGIQGAIDAWFKDGEARHQASIFPYAKKFDDIFATAGPFDINSKKYDQFYLHTSNDGTGKFSSLAVTLHPEVKAGLDSTMLAGYSYYFEVVRREFQDEDPEYLLVANYDQIIGSRWVAYLDPETVEQALQAHNPKNGSSSLPAVEPLEQKRPAAYVETTRSGEVYVMHQGVRTRHENLAEADKIVKDLNGSSPAATPKVDQARNGSSYMVKITDEVRDVLVASTTEGNVLKLPGQLERGLYAKVNETLNLLGGKWTRQKGGHVFGEDPAVLVAEALESGAIEDGVKRYQFYPTPEAVAQRLVALADINPKKIHWILEPSGGMGAILDEIPKSANIHTCEIQPVLAEALKARGYRVEGGDFMDFHPGALYDRIVANPPFTRGQDIAHIGHMLDCLAPGGRVVSVLSAGIDFRKDKATTALLDRLQKECSSFRFEDIESGAFRESGTLVNAKILIADKKPEA